MAPRTAVGRALALVVLVGALVVGPVGIVAAEVRRAARWARRPGMRGVWRDGAL